MPQPVVIGSFAFPLPVFHLFDYELNETGKHVPGCRYKLPFGNTSKTGILITIRSGESAIKGVKEVTSKIDENPLLSAEQLKLLSWLADYYCQPIGEVVFHGLPAYIRKNELLSPTKIKCWKLVTSISNDELLAIEKKAPRQFELLQALQLQCNGLTAIQLRAVNTAWQSPLKALQNRGWVSMSWTENLTQNHFDYFKAPTLTQEQKSIVGKIEPVLNRFLVHLIQGVTGSGKTEVYLALIESMLQSNKQVIYLVPEIGLTPQLLQRLQQRLGSTVVSSHSAQTDFQRYQSWDQLKRGAVDVLVGTRSALFSEARELGLIIIDEEHDASYRQQDGVRYHARDVAMKRAQMLDIPVVLGSATPAAETLYNASKSHFRHYRLEHRPNQVEPVTLDLVDCSQIPVTTGCSPRLIKAIEKHLTEGGQVLLYLNRRGFAPVVMCHDCGWQASCFQCDSKMTLHQSISQLICHHCGYRVHLPLKCPGCNAQNIKHYGVGTEQLEQYLQVTFNGVEIIRIDRDSVSSSQQFKEKMKPVSEGKPCILVGTQMLAKGHDYPNITLVGILDADQALFSSFYRASERLIQTVLQVSGRAGRSVKKGQALIQTAFPLHPVMQGMVSKNYSELILPILQERKVLGFPPFTRLVTFQVDALDLSMAIGRLQQIKQLLLKQDSQLNLTIAGPIPALMTRRVGRYRAQLSVFATEMKVMRELLRDVMPQVQNIRNTNKIRLTIEVDPADL